MIFGIGRNTFDENLFKEKLLVFEDLIDVSKWTKSSTTNETDIYTYDGANNASGLYSVGNFDFTVEEIIQFILKEDSFMKLNPLIEKISSVQEYGPGHNCFYMKIKKILLIASRDFVGITKVFTRNDGTIGVCVYSVEHEDAPVLTDGTIRGEMIIGGWYFQPIEGGNKTRATNFAVNDYKGSIPKFVLNMGASTQGSVFKGLRDILAGLKAKGELEGAKEFEQKFGFKLINGIDERFVK